MIHHETPDVVEAVEGAEAQPPHEPSKHAMLAAERIFYGQVFRLPWGECIRRAAEIIDATMPKPR